MGNVQEQPVSEPKKTWTVPELVMLDIRDTMASDELWQFVREGDFWKRELLGS
jgi:hypothetical protein